jgi:hypothetical protein
MTVPAQTAPKPKVVTTAPATALAVTLINGTKTTTVSAASTVATKVADPVVTTTAAPKAKTVVAVAPVVSVPPISTHGPNSDNGTTATAVAVNNRDVTA